ncbi:MAG: hypothetical protein R3247_05975 [Rhodothermales bacterium]|nr:hypothetical protein [Rhodothermales bacterium]
MSAWRPEAAAQGAQDRLLSRLAPFSARPGRAGYADTMTLKRGWAALARRPIPL